jgi:AcrR family transcriptional regulator
VPRTRHDVDREEKVAQLVDAAIEHIERAGYEGLSVAAISRDLGLAQNAVYWYFPTRDHLFVAAVEKMVERMLGDKPSAGSLVDHVIWFVDRLDASHGVIASLYVRARASRVVAEYEASFRARTQELLSEAMASLGPPEDAQEAATTLLCTIEGALLLGLSSEERDRVIRRAFDRLTR